jgi:hypothetical protein
VALGAGFAVAAVAPAGPGWVPPLAASVATYLGGAVLAAWGFGAGDRRRIARWLPTLIVGSVVFLLLLAALGELPQTPNEGSRVPGGRSRRRMSRRRPGDVAPVGALPLLPTPDAAAAILGGSPVGVEYELSLARAVLAVEWTAVSGRRMHAVVRDQAKAAARIRAGDVPSRGRQRRELGGIGDRAFIELRTGGDSHAAAVALAAVGTWVVMIRVVGTDPPVDADEVLATSLRSTVGALSASLTRLPPPPRW